MTCYLDLSEISVHIRTSRNLWSLPMTARHTLEQVLVSAKFMSCEKQQRLLEDHKRKAFTIVHCVADAGTLSASCTVKNLTKWLKSYLSSISKLPSRKTNDFKLLKMFGLFNLYLFYLEIYFLAFWKVKSTLKMYSVDWQQSCAGDKSRWEESHVRFGFPTSFVWRYTM